VTGDRPLIDWTWIAEHLDDIALRTLQHLWLAAIAVVAGFVIALGLALLIRRARTTYGPITAVAGILYTIPSLAMFAVLVPITGLSLLTAEIPLVIYTLLILVRSNVAGLDSVPADVVEAAQGMGLSGNQRLARVELPLAVPLMIAGIRLAAVSTIGLVMILTLIGDEFGGLGLFIKEGIQTFFATKIYVGAVLSVALAFAVDFAFVRLQRRLTPWVDARRAGA
jgi:osmoprotectant transport system permease protein